MTQIQSFLHLKQKEKNIPGLGPGTGEENVNANDTDRAPLQEVFSSLPLLPSTKLYIEKLSRKNELQQ